MNIIRKSLPPVLLLFLGLMACHGQKVENVRGAFDGEKLNITYDLNGSDATQKFKVSFYSSHDNYANALSFVTGDVGDNVVAGKAHRATWDVKTTLPSDFDKEIFIKVKAAPVPLAIAKIIRVLGARTGLGITQQLEFQAPLAGQLAQQITDGRLGAP